MDSLYHTGMTVKNAVLLIITVYLLAFTAHARHLGKTVYGDGIFYYSWLRSIAIDRDINFTNEYKTAGVTQPLTKGNAPGNKYSIGPALFWAPAYLATHTLVRTDGWSFPYQVAAGATSVSAAIVGLVLLGLLLKKNPTVTAITLLLIAGSTNLLFYGSIDAVNSHALSFFAATVFLILLARPKIPWLAAGVTLALLASIRLQDLVYILALLPLWKRVRWLPFIGGFVLLFIPQLAAWYALYGTLANPYLAGGETFDLTRPHILGVLFSPQSGLFLWTPVVAIGLAGLLCNAKKYRAYLLIFFVQLYFISSWSTWWQGASVSGRMFVSSLPLIAVGLSDMVKLVYANRLIRSILPLIAGAFFVLNCMGILYYLFTF